MGLYDTIYYKDKLPTNNAMEAVGYDPNELIISYEYESEDCVLSLTRDFQTKDLGQNMCEYTVENGKLSIKKYKEVKQASWQTCNGWFNGLQRGEEYWENENYSGTVRMYDFRYDVESKWDCWAEYSVTFTEGNVTNVEIFDFKAVDNTERVNANKALADKIKSQNAKILNKYFLHTKPLRWLRRKIHNALYSAGNFLVHLSLKVY